MLCINLDVHFENVSHKKNMTAKTYISHTTTTFSRCFLYLLYDISVIKQNLMIKHNKDTDKFKSLDIKKKLINNTKIIYKNNNKNHLQIFEAITFKRFLKTTINKIAFNTDINILNIFNN